MSSIHIIAVPPGFAPEHIREQWVGVTIPMLDQEMWDLILETIPRAKEEFAEGSNGNGYLVQREVAVEALREAGKEEAANFWRTPFGPYLQFKREVCEVVD